MSELRQGQPVKVRGVVTVLENAERLMVLQEGEVGLPVRLQAPLVETRVGDQVEVEGFTACEANAAVIVKPLITRVGIGAPVAAQPVVARKLFDGKQDFQRVQIIVHCLGGRTTGTNYQFELDARYGDRPLRVVGAFVLQPSFLRLKDHDLRFVGVPVTNYAPSGEPYSLTLYVSRDGNFEWFNQGRWVQDAQFSSEIQVPVASQLPVLHHVWDVKAMSNEEADKHYPVDLQGAITTCEPEGRFLFLDDGTAGIFLNPQRIPIPNLRLGEQVRIKGLTVAGAFAPVVEPEEIISLGRFSLPVPVRVNPAEGFRARDENRWVEMEGILHTVEEVGVQDLQLGLAVGPTMVNVRLKGAFKEAVAADIDSQVRIQGIYAPVWMGDQRLVGVEMRVPSMAQFQVLGKPRGDTLQSLPRKIRSLSIYQSEGLPRHRVKVEGLVTQVSSGAIYLADETGGIRVDGQLSKACKVGDCLQVLGFFRWLPTGVFLQDVKVAPSRTRIQVDPVPLTADMALSGAFDGRLVVMEGFVRDQSLVFGDRVLLLESGRTQFTAQLSHPGEFRGLDQLRAGALVKLTGVCQTQWDETLNPPSPISVRISLRGPQDISLMRAGPWWTVGRTMTLLVAVACALLLVILYLFVLKRRVTEGASQLLTQMKQREVLEEQLLQSQKLEGVGRLAGGVAHDFNNLLTVIGGYCDILLQGPMTEDEVQESVREVKKAADRASSLTRQLLAFSRKQLLRPVVLDVSLLVKDMENMVRRLVGEDIQLVMRLDPGPCRVLVDAGQLSQVLMNLVVNAKDAMPEGGKLVIETARLYLDASDLASRPEVQPGDYVRLNVTDTGCGMDEATLKQVFEPFFTTKELGKGTGLGLSTVFGIVKQSGGHIWAYSQVGLGTSFKIFFPFVHDEAAGDRAEVEELTLGGAETILVVEDQEEVRTFTCKCLQRLGYHVISAEGGPQALQLVEHYQGRIHLLLSDVVMPEMNGKVLAEKLQSRLPNLKVLFMSGYTTDVIAHKGILDPEIDFIQKPFSSRELSKKVEELLREGLSEDRR